MSAHDCRRLSCRCHASPDGIDRNEGNIERHRTAVHASKSRRVDAGADHGCSAFAAGKRRQCECQRDICGWQQPVECILNGGIRGRCRRIGRNRRLARQAGLLYVEGIALSAGSWTPLRREWCVDHSTGEVVDATWTNGIAYFGVPLDLDFVERVHRSRLYGAVLDVIVLLRSGSAGEDGWRWRNASETAGAVPPPR